jgi:hypothetical protein
MIRLLATMIAATAFALQAPSIDALVAKMREVHAERGSRIRATLTVTPRGGAPVSKQLLILARRERAGTWTSYQQLWPDARGGRVLVIDPRGPGQLNGFVHAAGRATPLTDRMQEERFFDSDFRLEDVAERFWAWPSRGSAGEESIGAYRCAIAEIRPPAGTPSAYGFLRAWIAPEIAMALRIDQFGRDGALVKRIELFRPTRLVDRWVPTIVTVETADGRSRSVIEGASEEADDSLTRADFTIAAVTRRLAAGAR